MIFQRIKTWIDDRIKGIPLGTPRSPQWEGVRNAFAHQHPLCEVCNSKKIEIHHVVAFHLDPSRELDPTNFISLCRPHHCLFGHFMNWKSINKDVREDAKQWFIRIQNRPE